MPEPTPRARANQSNAARSTGPTSAPGKARSSENALRHGVLSSKLLLPEESAEDYRALLQSLLGELGPVGTMEQLLVGQLPQSDEAWIKDIVTDLPNKDMFAPTQFQEVDNFLTIDHESLESWIDQTLLGYRKTLRVVAAADTVREAQKFRLEQSALNAKALPAGALR